MNNIKRVLFLNQMAGPLFRELAEDLSKNFKIRSELFTGHPDTLRFVNCIDSLSITQSPVYNRRSKFTRLISWLKYTIFAFIKILFVPRGTLVFIVSNPPLLGPFAYIACRIRNLPYIVLVYDMHPDTLVNFGVLDNNSSIVKIWRYINKSVWENSCAVYTIGEFMAKNLSNQFDVEKTILKEVVVIPPWADTDKIKPIEKFDNPLAGDLDQNCCTTVLYSGNMGISHDIESMLKAAKLLKNRSDVKFLFIGDGEKWQYAFDFVVSEQLTNVQVLPFQPENVLPYTMALGDISLVSLDKGAEGLMIPSKMFYYIAAGSAVIGISHGYNDLQDTVSKGRFGLTVTPGDFENLANSILSLANDKNELSLLKSNARKSSVKYFSRQACILKLEDSLRTINLIPIKDS